jgi:uncharacterized protein (DUF342 family)
VFGDKAARTRKRLTSLSEKIQADRQRLAVAEEQVQFLSEVEADARTDAVVASDLNRVREHTVAQRDLERAVRDRDEIRAGLEARRAEQDRLLGELLDGGAAPLD